MLHDDPQEDTDQHGHPARGKRATPRQRRAVQAGDDPPDGKPDREGPQHPEEALHPGVLVMASPTDGHEHQQHRDIGERGNPDRYVTLAHWAILADVLGRRPIRSGPIRSSQ